MAIELINKLIRVIAKDKGYDIYLVSEVELIKFMKVTQKTVVSQVRLRYRNNKQF